MNDYENLSDDYIVKDISNEMWREIYFLKTEKTYRIKYPKTLIIRKGGSTHRVVDSDDIVHCYAAPEFGETVIKWKSLPTVNF